MTFATTLAIMILSGWGILGLYAILQIIKKYPAEILIGVIMSATVWAIQHLVFVWVSGVK